MELDISLVLFITVINIVAFIVKGIAGFGDPLISAPLLSMRLDSRLVSPTNLCISLPTNIYMSWKNRKFFSAKETIPMAVCILVGVIPGTLLLKYATSWVLKALLGVLVIGIGVEMLTRGKAKASGKQNPVLMAVISFCSGFTAGLFGINLFFVANVERTAQNKEGFRGNICFIFLIENIFRTALYIATGVLGTQALILALISLPGVAVGLFIGSRVDAKLSEATVRKVIIFTFILTGLSVLVKALIWHS